MRSILLFLLLMALVGQLCFASSEHVYSTWDVLELDTCASAWLIKNFIDRQAEFKFYPKGEFITEGIAFDTPDAKFRRTGNMSTFESILKEYKINEVALLKIGQMIHDIEIDFWSGSKVPAQELNQKVLDIIRKAKTPKKAFDESFPVFDELYKSLLTFP